MAMMTIRNLPDDVHRALRMQAAQHGRSTEAEVLTTQWRSSLNHVFAWVKLSRH